MNIKPVRKNNDIVIEIDTFPIKSQSIDLRNLTLDVYEAKSLAYSILSIVAHIDKDERIITKSILTDLQKFRYSHKD